MKFNNETIKAAVKEYYEDSKEAEKKYGHISEWDVSNVGDMWRIGVKILIEEKLNPKISNNDAFKNTIEFTNELKKYIDSHNDTAEIEVSPSNGGVWEEYIYRGTWNSKKFKMKAIIPLKNADYRYDGNLSEFIEKMIQISI